MAFSDALLIILISFVSTLLSEGFLWLLIYRRDAYVKLKDEIDNMTRKLEKMKEEIDLKQPKSKEKKLLAFEEQLKLRQRDMASSKMKSTLIVAVMMMALFGVLSSTFDGIVVAKLPFEPISLVQNISHRNLSGKDSTDCSFYFIFALCAMSVRANVQKFLGFSPKSEGFASMFPAQPEENSR